MGDVSTLFSTTLKKCDKVMEKMDVLALKAQELLKMSDWKQFVREIYDNNTGFIDNASDEMLQEWSNGKHFNSGMFAGELDRIIIDKIPS